MAGYLQGALFGKGATNPYVAPNIDFLKQPAAKTDYSGLMTYKDPTAGNAGQSGSAFRDYIGAVGAQGQNQQEALKNLLGGIQRDTNTTYGSEISKRFGMGQYEPGMGPSSDIAGNALAQIQAGGARTAADARTSYLSNVLQQQADAYGKQYANANTTDTQNRGLANQDMLAYYTGEGANTAAENARRTALAQILSGQASASASSYRPATYGAVGGGLDEYFKSLGQSSGASSSDAITAMLMGG